METVQLAVKKKNSETLCGKETTNRLQGLHTLLPPNNHYPDFM